MRSQRPCGRSRGCKKYSSGFTLLAIASVVVVVSMRIFSSDLHEPNKHHESLMLREFQEVSQVSFFHSHSTESDLAIWAHRYSIFEPDASNMFEIVTKTHSFTEGCSYKMYVYQGDDIISNSWRGDGAWDVDLTARILDLYEQYILQPIERHEHAEEFKMYNHVNFIDMGTNIGSITIPVAKYFECRGFKNNHVHSFEPLYSTMLCALNGIRVNKLSNVRMFPYAVSDAQHGSVFEMMKFVENYGGTEISKKLNASELERKERRNNIGVITNVNTYTALSPFIDEIRNTFLVKIDIEGQEMSVLKSGASFWSSDDAPCILILETRPHTEADICEFLQNLGFEAREINSSVPMTKDTWGKHGLANIEFWKKDVDTCARRKRGF